MIFFLLSDFLVDLWDIRDHFALLLLNIWDSLAEAFFCTVFLRVLRLVSVRSPLVCFACH